MPLRKESAGENVQEEEKSGDFFFFPKGEEGRKKGDSTSWLNGAIGICRRRNHGCFDPQSSQRTDAQKKKKKKKKKKDSSGFRRGTALKYHTASRERKLLERGNS
jgi:hypothetical protein